MTENDSLAEDVRAPVNARVKDLYDFARVDRSFADRSIGGDKLTNLDQIPAGAGTIPSANLPGASVPNASTTERGIIELATTAEANAGTDTERAVVPSGLLFRIAGTNALKGPNFSEGNPGSNAIDIQTTRGSATAIASGSSAIAIGRGIRASGNDSIGIGRLSQITANDGIGLGRGTTVSGSYGVAVAQGASAGGYASVAIGVVAQAPGAQAIAIGSGVVNSVDNSIKLGVSAVDFLHLTTFTPAVGAGVASTHTLSVNISGVVYRVLLANP